MNNYHDIQCPFITQTVRNTFLQEYAGRGLELARTSTTSRNLARCACCYVQLVVTWAIIAMQL